MKAGRYVLPCGFELGFMGFVCNYLRSVQPPEPQSLGLIHFVVVSTFHSCVH